MVIVIVTEQNQMDRRQGVEGDRGSRTRRAPSQEKGPARVEKIGSVRIFTPAICKRKLAWPI